MSVDMNIHFGIESVDRKLVNGIIECLVAIQFTDETLKITFCETSCFLSTRKYNPSVSVS